MFKLFLWSIEKGLILSLKAVPRHLKFTKSTRALWPPDFCGKTMQMKGRANHKNYSFFDFPDSLSWQPTADQRA